jgi:transposase-like protein
MLIFMPAPESNSQFSTASDSLRPRTTKAERRKFSDEYKLWILERTDGLTNSEIKEVLDREGVGRLQLGRWRQQKQSGRIQAPARDVQERESKDRQLQNAKQQMAIEWIKQAELLIEVQKGFVRQMKILVEGNGKAS